MRGTSIRHYALVGCLLLLGGAGGFLVPFFGQSAPHERSVTITAHKYAYDPPILRVNKGDHVRIKFQARDVTHGFFLEGYDLEAKARPENPSFWVRKPSAGGDYEEVEQIDFLANRSGKFRYRCSITCGYMHPFMQGELIVSPNYVFPISVGLSLGLFGGVLVLLRRKDQGKQP